MKIVLGFIGLFLGWLLASTSTFLWIGYSIFQLVKTDLGFFEIVLPNIFFWLLQLIAGIVLIGIGKGFADN